MSRLTDTSFDGDVPIADINMSNAEFSVEDEPMMAAKKLQGSFDDVAGQQADTSLKVFLRVRPPPHTTQTTIKCVSDTEIHTTAPEVSNRAKYTKTEERQYVSIALQCLTTSLLCSSLH
jgi:hypothetical protein